MAYKEEDFLQISGLQHFQFCRRQWALIYLEQLWHENLRTVEGGILHQKAHDASQWEHRGDRVVLRDLRVFSARLGISGACDVVEFIKSENGIPLSGQEGTFQPFPVEYKRGSPRDDHAKSSAGVRPGHVPGRDVGVRYSQGALYYGEIRRREIVPFTPELRKEVETALADMHSLYQRGHTPKVRPSKSCNACSLKELCLPKLMKKKSVAQYLQSHMEELP